MRMKPGVAQVINNQCQACRVTVTSSGMQMLRKGDELVHCENCGRIPARGLSCSCAQTGGARGNSGRRSGL